MIWRRAGLALALSGLYAGGPGAQSLSAAACIWEATPVAARAAMHDALAGHRDLVDVAEVVAADRRRAIRSACRLPDTGDSASLIASVLRGHVLRDAGWLILWRQGVRLPELDDAWVLVPARTRQDFAVFFDGGMRDRQDDAEVLGRMSQRLKLVSARGRVGLFDYAIGRGLLESVGE